MPLAPQVPIPGADTPPKLGEPFEALLYVHGFASSLHESTLPFGQLLALAALPGHIKPFIFSWPCGHFLTYFQAKRMAKSSEIAQVSRKAQFIPFVGDVMFLSHFPVHWPRIRENIFATGFGRCHAVPGGRGCFRSPRNCLFSRRPALTFCSACVVEDHRPLL